MNLFRFISMLAALFILNNSVFACAVCNGDPNSQLAVASDATLWMLLALVGFIFVATGATAYFLFRKAREHNAPVPQN